MSKKIMEDCVKEARSEDEWNDLVKSWKSSDISKVEFCRKHKLTPSNFYRWCRKFDGAQQKKSKTSKRVKPSRDEKSAFVEIIVPKTIDSSSKQGRTFRVTTSYGAVLEFPI